jgi:rhodanese-related sulfurtransferase
MVATIEREALKAKIDRGEKFTLVETLAEAAFCQGHLPGAVNLPPDRVKERAQEVLPDREAEIIVYCAKPT